MPAVLENVAFRYGSRSGWALDGVSFRLEPGTLTGLIGPNGSGKTTLYKLMLGMLAPARGSLAIYGTPAASYRRRQGIGYLPEQVRLPANIRVQELAVFVARLAGLDGPPARRAVAELAFDLLLDEVLDTRIGALSHGYRQRVGLLVALLGSPKLLLLDEPANGLDPVSIGVLRSVLRRLKRDGRSVVVSSHNLLELERLSDVVLVLSEGKLLGQVLQHDLVEQPDVWVVQLGSDLDGAIGDPGRAGEGAHLARDEVAFRTEAAARAFAAKLSYIGRRVEQISRRPFDLECLFHFLISGKEN